MTSDASVVTALSDHHIRQLHALYQAEWWSCDRTLSQTRSAVQGSQLCIGMLGPDDQLLAFTRVLTDYTFKALIFDVIVAEPWRRRTLGDQLIQLVRSHPSLKSVLHFELYCLPELQDFYARHGFTSELGGVRLMRVASSTTPQAIA